MRCRGEVSNRNGDLCDEHFVDCVNVEFELRGYWYYWTAVCDCSSDKLQNALVVLFGVVFLHQVDLVLENDDVLELHNLNGGEMFASLGLGTCFIAGDEKQRSVLGIVSACSDYRWANMWWSELTLLRMDMTSFSEHYDLSDVGSWVWYRHGLDQTKHIEIRSDCGGTNHHRGS